MKWQFEQGSDATKLLFEYRKVRLPDMAWFATFPLIFIPWLLGYKNVEGFAFLAFSLFVYIELVSLVFLYSRFFLRFGKVRTIYAVFVNSLFMSSYLLGRYVGIFKPTNKEKEL